MAKHLIFMVHGMGDFKPGWSDGVETLMKTSFRKFMEGVAFSDEYEFIEINYNALFEERRQEWGRRAEVLAGVFASNGLSDGAVQKLLKFAGAPGGDGFLQTHVLDAVMYRFLPQVAEHVRRTVQDKILSTLQAGPHNVAPNWSIICHSLGTSVTHDTLQAMFTHEVNGVLLHSNYRPNNVFMVGNVSRVLWHSGSVYETSVKPHPRRERGLCQRYYNFQHELDPFPQ